MLGEVGYRGTEGASDAVTEKTSSEVIDIVTEQGGVLIPAHVDKEKGLFHLQGNTLKGILKNPNIYAMELCEDNYEKPQIYQDMKLQWTEVRGSDAHNTEQSNGIFTWIKMDSPSIEGLKLALIDGRASCIRNMDARPNQHSNLVIEEVAVNNAKYIGRPDSSPAPLKLQFSPFLNSIIGGRGSGKSSLLEFMRLVLRQEDDLPDTLKEDSKKYFEGGSDGLLLKDTQISLIYRKEDVRYRLNWAAIPELTSLEIENEDGEWQAEEGEILHRFPAYIYSQKQIFSFAQQVDTLLNIIDRNPEVQREDINRNVEELITNYKRIRNDKTNLENRIEQKNTIQGQLNDVIRQIKQIEKSGHKEVLEKYRKRQRQKAVLDIVEEQWQEMNSDLETLASQIMPAEFDKGVFDGDEEMLRAVDTSNAKWNEVHRGVQTLAEQGRKIVGNWDKEKENAAWGKQLQRDIEQYGQIQTQLEQQGIDPHAYPQLLHQQETLKRELVRIEEYKEGVRELKNSEEEVLGKILTVRNELTVNRREFLADALKNNDHIKIKVNAMEQKWSEVETELRQILQCQGDKFERDFLKIKEIYSETDKSHAVKQIKELIIDICQRAEARCQDKRFAANLQNLPLESIDNLICWFPEDSLDIQFQESGKQKSQSIEQGSPGQKTAALLAFILSYGNEPLLLDQPEDDLDNEVIYDLIVQTLRKIKSERQVIVVTHNANIVVNGDAEMVFPLEVACGQTKVRCEGSIQTKQTRARICDILEGGEQAFEQRYRRIHLDSDDIRH